MKGSSVGFCVLFQMVVVLPSSFAQEKTENDTPPLCDLAGLELKVVNVQSVPEIKSVTGTLKTTSDDLRLVVVTMKGQKAARDAETPSLFLQDIQAVYAEPKREKKDFGYAVSPAVGVVMADLMGDEKLWIFTKQTQPGTMRTPANGGSLVVAFQLPKHVKRFSVRIPATIKDGTGSVVQTIKQK